MNQQYQLVDGNEYTETYNDLDSAVMALLASHCLLKDAYGKVFNIPALSEKKAYKERGFTFSDKDNLNTWSIVIVPVALG